MVQEGRRNATSNVPAFGEAAFWKISFVAEREDIALLRAQGCTVQEVARRIGRAASTISRELRRNAATRSGGFGYCASAAPRHAERSAPPPKQAKRVFDPAVEGYC